MARIDRLDEDLKQVLRLASVIGRSFFYRLLAAISEAERELDESLAGLEARELVLEKARDPELEYIFKHALVQEATYESILKQRRRDLHGSVAAAIESAVRGPARGLLQPSRLPLHDRPRTGRRPRSTSSRRATRPGASPPTPRRLAHYEERCSLRPAPSATPGSRRSGRLWSARWARPSTVEGIRRRPRSTYAGRSRHWAALCPPRAAPCAGRLWGRSCDRSGIGSSPGSSRGGWRLMRYEPPRSAAVCTARLDE